MEMQRTSDVLRELLVRQGMTRGLAGTRSRGTKVASAPLIGEEDDGPERSPTAGGSSAGLNLGKGRQVNAAAKFTGLHVVVDNSRNGRTQPQRVCPPGVRPFLVLVQS